MAKYDPIWVSMAKDDQEWPRWSRIAKYVHM